MKNHNTDEHLGQLKSDIPGGTDKDTEHFGQVITRPWEEFIEFIELDDACVSIPKLLWEVGIDGDEGGEDGRDWKGAGEEGIDWEGADAVDVLILFGGGTGLVAEVFILFCETVGEEGFSVVPAGDDALYLLSYMWLTQLLYVLLLEQCQCLSLFEKWTL